MEHEVFCDHSSGALANQTVDDGGASQVGYIEVLLWVGI